MGYGRKDPQTIRIEATTDAGLKQKVDGLESQLAQTENKLPFASVLDFGAVGDGITNDTEAIINALEAGNVSFPSQKTFLIDTIKIPYRRIIELNGATLKFNTVNTCIYFDGEVSVDNFRISLPIGYNDFILKLVSDKMTTSNGFLNTKIKKIRVSGESLGENSGLILVETEESPLEGRSNLFHVLVQDIYVNARIATGIKQVMKIKTANGRPAIGGMKYENIMFGGGSKNTIILTYEDLSGVNAVKPNSVWWHENITFENVESQHVSGYTERFAVLDNCRRTVFRSCMAWDYYLSELKPYLVRNKDRVRIYLDGIGEGSKPDDVVEISGLSDFYLNNVYRGIINGFNLFDGYVDIPETFSQTKVFNGEVQLNNMTHLKRNAGAIGVPEAYSLNLPSHLKPTPSVTPLFLLGANGYGTNHFIGSMFSTGTKFNSNQNGSFCIGVDDAGNLLFRSIGYDGNWREWKKIITE